MLLDVVLIKLRRYIKYLRMYLLTIIIANRKENSMASIHDVEDVFGKKPNSIPEIIVFTFFSLSVLLSLVFIFPLICFFVLRNPNARLFSTWTFSFVFVEQYTHTHNTQASFCHQSIPSKFFVLYCATSTRTRWNTKTFYNQPTVNVYILTRSLSSTIPLSHKIIKHKTPMHTQRQTETSKINV